MHYSDVQIVLQEVPGEISICFTISGCNIRCEGCHSPHIWKEGSGNKLTNEYFLEVLTKYLDFATCVLFMGGEWHPTELVHYLKSARNLKYKTCLYTGQDYVDSEISSELTWLKTGSWIEKHGGLENTSTNQVFRDVKTNKKMNHLFK